MIEYWFEGFVIFMLLGISGRLWFIGREISYFHHCFHDFEDDIMGNETVELQDDDGKLRVMALEDFMDEFGFDPRNPPADKEKAITDDVEAWDNAKV